MPIIKDLVGGEKWLEHQLTAQKGTKYEYKTTLLYWQRYFKEMV